MQSDDASEAGASSSGMCTLSTISSDDTATPYPPPQPQPMGNFVPLFDPWPNAAAMQPPPAQDEMARRDQLQAWRHSVHQVSLRKAKHDVAAQEYASMRAAARHTTSLLNYLPRELHRAIAWHVVHKRAEEDASHRVQRMATRLWFLYADTATPH